MKYQASDEAKDKLSFLVYGLIFVFFVGVSVAVLWVSSQRSRFEKRETIKEIVLEPMASVEARLVSTAFQTYSVRILNATGVSGLAAKSAKQLEDEGIKLNLQTGNSPLASGIKASFRSILLKESKLGASVKKIWPEVETSIVESQSEDMVLVVGK